MQDDHLKELEHSLAVIEGFGIHYLDLVKSSIYALQQAYYGDANLSGQQIEKLFQICERSVDKHMSLLRMSNQDRLNYSDE